MNLNVQQMAILIMLGVIGSAAVLPYSAALQSQMNLSLKIIVLSLVQGVVLTAIAVFVGMLASKSLGLQVTSPPQILPLAVLLGIAAGTVIIALELLVFHPHLPEAISFAAADGGAAPDIAIWKRLLASLYGGISEELLMRFFLLSGFLWLITRVWSGPQGQAVQAAFWIVNIVIALLFGLGHLPALLQMVEKLTPMLLARTLVLNGIAGIIFGWLYWKHGLAAAMVSHFSADIVLHVISPMVTHYLKSGASGGV